MELNNWMEYKVGLIRLDKVGFIIRSLNRIYSSGTLSTWNPNKFICDNRFRNAVYKTKDIAYCWRRLLISVFGSTSCTHHYTDFASRFNCSFESTKQSVNEKSGRWKRCKRSIKMNHIFLLLKSFMYSLIDLLLTSQICCFVSLSTLLWLVKDSLFSALSLYSEVICVLKIIF